MRCERYRSIASELIDRPLTKEETAEHEVHLNSCLGCAAYADDIGRMALALRDMATPDVPPELHSYILTSVRREASGEVDWAQRVYEWLLKLNPRVVSYAAGAVVSTLLFTLTMASFKPIPVSTPMAAAAVAGFDVITGSDDEYHTYNDLPPDSDGIEHFYELPRAIEHSSLVSFSLIAYQKPGKEGAAALVEVTPQGQARILEVLGESADPRLIDLLQWSLSKRPFYPAKRIGSGEPLTTRIVLFVEKMDVTG